MCLLKNFAKYFYFIFYIHFLFVSLSVLFLHLLIYLPNLWELEECWGKGEALKSLFSREQISFEEGKLILVNMSSLFFGKIEPKVGNMMLHTLLLILSMFLNGSFSLDMKESVHIMGWMKQLVVSIKELVRQIIFIFLLNWWVQWKIYKTVYS